MIQQLNNDEDFGRGKSSLFIESAVRPHLLDADLSAAYQAMAADEEREAEAEEWAEATLGDVSNEQGEI